MARIRSPNYPQISLPAALERVRSIYKAERQNRVHRDDALRLIGFGGYNGASAGVLSALHKYGLLDDLKDHELRVSDLTVRIIVPHDDAEKADAVREAAANPPLFQELAERWPDNQPSDHSLRTYLTRRGFADSALEGVMKSYADTLNLVNALAAQYVSSLEEKEETMDQVVTPTENRRAQQIDFAPAAPPPVVASDGPAMNLVRTKGGYIVQLSGTVLSKEHVGEVVTLLTALKASMPDKTPGGDEQTEH